MLRLPVTGMLARTAAARTPTPHKEMLMPAKKTPATVIPCLRYRDAPGAIDWLCRVFGFEKHLVVPNGSLGAFMRNADGNR